MGIQDRRERERAARRKAVLQAARELVRERGFTATTTKEIAARCELSEATLFWHFGSKDEILTSLLFEGIDFMAAGLDRLIERRADPEDKIARLWKFLAQVRSEHPEYFHVFSYLAHPQTTAAVSEEVKAELLRRSADNFRRLIELLRGVVDPEDARISADLVWSSFLGLMLLRDSRRNLGAAPHPSDHDLRRALELLTKGLFKGAAKQRARGRR